MRTTYEIRIFTYGKVVRVLHPKNKTEAKRLYYFNEESASQYTQLIVNGKALNTAAAKKFLGTIRR